MSGRTDFIVHSNGIPRALFEIKVAAEEHGNQLERYEEWAVATAAETGHPIQCFVMDLFLFDYTASSQWRCLTLTTFVTMWSASVNEHARLLAASMAATIGRWVTQLGQPLGLAASPVVASMAVKVATSELRESHWAQKHAGFYPSRDFSDHGGNAGMYHFLPFPEEPEYSWLSLDVRAGSRRNPAARWAFRLGVDTDLGDRTLGEASGMHWTWLPVFGRTLNWASDLGLLMHVTLDYLGASAQAIETNQ